MHLGNIEFGKREDKPQKGELSRTLKPRHGTCVWNLYHPRENPCGVKVFERESIIPQNPYQYN